MQKEELNKLIEATFSEELQKMRGRMSFVLYPAAFADENSWRHVEEALQINNAALISAVKRILAEVVQTED